MIPLFQHSYKNARRTGFPMRRAHFIMPYTEPSSEDY